MHLLIILSYIRPWNWKAFEINSEKDPSWHGIIISPTYHVQECREAYGKNWMHFVYKTDNLFRSIRVSYGNSLVTKGFHFFWTYLNSIVFCVQNAPFKATSSFFNPFWLHLLFFMHLLIILSYKTLKLESISNELWKGWKLAWYHHLTHIACPRK